MTPSGLPAAFPPHARRRTAVVVGVGVGLYVVTQLLDFDPDPIAVLLATALAFGVLSLLTQAVNPFASAWYPPRGADPLTRGRDGATFADLRLLESHQTARHPDGHLRRRLALLADRALRSKHGVGLGTDEGRALLGPDVAALLDDTDSNANIRARRISPRDVDLCLRTIEEL